MTPIQSLLKTPSGDINKKLRKHNSENSMPSMIFYDNLFPGTETGSQVSIQIKSA